MEITPEQIIHLEQRVEKIEDKLDTQLDVLAKMNEKLKILDKIETGLFGDEKLGHLGVIKTQISLQAQIDDLECKIVVIENKNVEQDVALKTKKSVFTIVLDVVKWLGLAYLVGKGVFGADQLFGKFL